MSANINTRVLELVGSAWKKVKERVLEVTTLSSDSINAQSTLDLFKKWEEKYPFAQRIVVICDNAAYYRSKIVANYLKTSRVEIKFLPPYSPDLNLIERLWRFMNKKVRNNRY
ncbi:DDE superfamily endonuclease [Candidatus Rhabdochlamydia oedothoracis]|uniref:DDE superfamily endonuclease n=2 Tax=Candidatus Rhabdochlamydia TaxID=292833 RepID=A0ABX8V5Q2_9BACT|nr:transposase [Candidatus Rhabdochlamydia oedothoracis]QYF48368.1 DDE superfamily endonuclease [Candidatus Rhabdochlamydia oedothoracis]